MAKGEARIALLLGAAAFLFFLLFNHAHFIGSDEVAVYEMTRSLVERGDLAVPSFRHTEVGADGRRYSYFTAGQAILAIPLFSLGQVAGEILPHAWQRAIKGPRISYWNYVFGGEVEAAFVGLYSPITSALLVVLFFFFQRRLGVSPTNSLVSSLLLATTTYVALMSVYFLRHTGEAITLLGGFYFFYRYKESGELRDLWLGSAVASATFLLRVPAAVSGPVLAGYLIWVLGLRSGWGRQGQSLVRALPAVLVPFAVSLSLHMAINYAKWGEWLGSPMVGQVSRMVNPIAIGLWGFLLSPGSSIFVYSPLLVLGVCTFPLFWRERRAECIAIVALSLVLLIFYSKFDGWEGLWSAPGPRYLFVLAPFGMLPLGSWLDRTPGAGKWVAVSVLAGIGFFVQFVSMSVRWGEVPALAGYPDFEPRWSFLFLPQHSPVAEMTRILTSGEHIDPWLWNLWHGWEGFPGQPLAASLLGLLWLTAFAGCLWGLARELRRTRIDR